MDTDRNLLFGVLTLQADLINDSQFAEACTPWAARKDVALGELFVERGWITPSHRAELERSLERRLQGHGGDVRAVLATVANDEATWSLEALGDPDIDRLLALAIPPSPAELTTVYAEPVHMGGEAGAETSPEPRAPQSRYTLTRLHKEGGLSEVWVARDRDLNREVALKKLQLRQAASPEAARRFVKEAQVTGQLEHPNIVPVYELAAASEDQQPFYTMRLVRGQNLRHAIADYHRRRRKGNVDPLELPRLLRGFVNVCNAIGYSHSRGVVHRDLKPENVVVGEFGEVMVLDWGLAKLMDQPGTSAEAATDMPTVTDMAPAEATTAGSVLGTPAYMAPEQADGRLELIDYRTDIYGLGATLFTILVGRPPHQVDSRADLIDRVAHGETPSVRLVEPSVPPALDAICAKAMARDRAARYDRASELADDIERYLADEPVTAYPETRTRRLARWARHHRTFTRAAALVLVAVTFSSAAATLLVNNARRSESRAKEQATQRLQETREAVDTLLTGVSEGLKDVPGAQKVRKQLLEKASEAYERFTRETSSDVDLQSESARALVRLAEIRRTLGDLNGAEAACRSAEALFDKLSSQNPGAPDHRLGLASSRDQLGLALDQMGRLEEAETAYRAAIAAAEPLVTAYPDVGQYPNYRDRLAHSRTGLGIVLDAMSRRDDAETAYRAAVTDGQMLVNAHPTVSSFRNNLARSRANLANLLQVLGRPNDAEIEYRSAIADLESLLNADPEVPGYRNRLAITRSNLGALLKNLGRGEAAELSYRAAIEDYEALVDYNPAVPEYRAGLVAAYQNLGDLLGDQNKREEAEAAYQRASDEGTRLVADQPNAPEYLALVGDTWRHLGMHLRELGPARLEDSLRALEEAVRIHQVLVDGHSDVLRYRQNLEKSLNQRGVTLSELQRPSEALEPKELVASVATSRDREQAIRPLRSASQRLVSDLEIGPTDLADAAKLYASRHRVAVLPVVQLDGHVGMPYPAAGFMETMLADLRYVPDYLALDSSEVLADLDQNGTDGGLFDLQEVIAIGRRLGARYIFTGSFSVVDDNLRLTVQAIDSLPEARVVAAAEAVRPRNEIFALSDAVIQDLLKQMGSLPDPAKVGEMSKIPTLSFEARRECDSGFALVNQAARQPLGEALELSEKALQHAEAALQTDPSYLQAYLLKASCLWNLDRRADMEACLRAARIKSDPSSVDELTRLELEGDYATFVEKNFDKAIDSYQKMLEIDAGHIRALWSLAALYSGDYGAADVGLDDPSVAAEYAARLVQAHPESPMARSFEIQLKSCPP